MVVPENGIRWQLENHEDRLKGLESLGIAVLANRISTLEKRVDGMSRALWTAAVAFLITAATFAMNLILQMTA